MKQQLEARLQELEREHEAGQKMLAELDTKRQTIATTLLRIEGAMQVLREMLQPNEAESAAGGESPPPAA